MIRLRNQPRFRAWFGEHEKIQIGTLVKSFPLGIGTERCHGEHALLRYLAEACQEAAQGTGGDTRQIRLETDADLVWW